MQNGDVLAFQSESQQKAIIQAHNKVNLNSLQGLTYKLEYLVASFASSIAWAIQHGNDGNVDSINSAIEYFNIRAINAQQIADEHLKIIESVIQTTDYINAPRVFRLEPTIRLVQRFLNDIEQLITEFNGQYCFGMLSMQECLMMD